MREVDMDELFLLNVPTLVHIPKAVQSEVAAEYARILKTLHYGNQAEQEDACRALEAFARYVLRYRSPSERKADEAAGLMETTSQTVSRRLASWKRGDLAYLHAAVRRHARENAKERKEASKKPRSPAKEAAAEIARAERLTREGAPGRACQSLLSTSMAAVTPQNLQKLRDLHPPRRTPAAGPPADIELPKIRFKKQDLLRALRSFGKMTSAGVTALRAEHLQQLCEADASLRTTLLDFANHVVDGDLPPEAWRHFAGGSLAALGKPGGGVRPIAAGEVLRRLVSKMATNHALRKKELAGLGDLFAGMQYGVGDPMGAERVIHHAAMVWHENWTNDDVVALKIDAKNAFNNISREEIMNAVLRHTPALHRYVSACYDCSPQLRATAFEAVVVSEEGTQQGDPLGPLLFALAILDLCSRLREKCPQLLVNKWYLDDGVLIGHKDEVLEAFYFLLREGAEIGLDLNPAKCEIIGKSAAAITAFVNPGLGNLPVTGSAHAELMAAASRLADTMADNAQKTTLHQQLMTQPEATVRRMLAENGIPVWPEITVAVGTQRVSGHFELLGGIVSGNAATVGEYFTDTRVNGKAPVPRIEQICTRIGTMEDSQCAFALLRTCVAFCRLSYATRTCPPDLVSAHAKRCDAAVFNALAGSLGTMPLSKSAATQAALGIDAGGLGLRRNADHAEAAFVASVLDSARADGWIDSVDSRPGFTAAVTALAARTGKTAAEIRSAMPEATTETLRHGNLQQKFSKWIDGAILKELREGGGIDTSDHEPWANADKRKARLLSAAGTEAGAWLLATPCKWHHTEMSPDEFRTAVRLRLGEPVMEAGTCSACGNPCDAFGHHATSCHGRGSLGQRHNHVRDVLFRILKEHACLQTQKEVVVPIVQDRAKVSLERPADVMFVHAEGGDRRVAVDVAITQPLQQQFVKRASATARFAANEYATKAKLRKYCAAGTSQLAGNAEVTLMPFVFETFGAPADGVDEVVTIAASGWAKAAEIKKEAAKRRILQQIATALQRQNAKMVIDRRIGVLPAEATPWVPATFAPEEPISRSELHGSRPPRPSMSVHRPEEVDDDVNDTLSGELANRPISAPVPTATHDGQTADPGHRETSADDDAARPPDPGSRPPDPDDPLSLQVAATHAAASAAPLPPSSDDDAPGDLADEAAAKAASPVAMRPTQMPTNCPTPTPTPVPMPEPVYVPRPGARPQGATKPTLKVTAPIPLDTPSHASATSPRARQEAHATATATTNTTMTATKRPTTTSTTTAAAATARAIAAATTTTTTTTHPAHALLHTAPIILLSRASEESPRKRMMSPSPKRLPSLGRVDLVRSAVSTDFV